MIKKIKRYAEEVFPVVAALIAVIIIIYMIYAFAQTATMPSLEKPANTAYVGTLHRTVDSEYGIVCYQTGSSSSISCVQTKE